MIFSIRNIFNSQNTDGALAQNRAQHFYIAPYQRGYKWGSTFPNDPVCLLMKDIIDASEISSNFDTNKSKQGEELYIYMNSRGVSVSSNESIKANLLKGLSDKEKHDWGIKWEKWQDLFWKNKKSNLNADRGFEEFLKWIKMIEYIKHSSSTDTQQAQQAKLRELKDSKKITNEYFSLIGIENYFLALNTLIELLTPVNFKFEWLMGQTEAVDYIRLIPILMYAEKYPQSPKMDIGRFSRFFYNIVRFDILSKIPYLALINVVTLTQLFLDSNYTDVTDLNKLTNNKSFDNILTLEEIIKLTLYSTQDNPDQRTKIEHTFWEAEDHKYCNGKVSFLLDYVDPQLTLANIGIFDYEKFNAVFTNFKILFNNPDDILRRALLTKGDYFAYDGRTSTLEGDRYSFFAEDWRWRQQFPNKNKVTIFKALIQDFSQRKEKAENLQRDQILNVIIADFLLKYSNFDWRYHVICKPEVLAYCQQKFICFSGDIVYLLKERNAAVYNWVKLEKHLGYE
jgi:hypothetical protein